LSAASTTHPAAQQGGGVERLAALVHLERRARSADNLVSLGFTMVNETLALLPYRQAVLFGRTKRGGETLAVSGASEPARDAPFTIWVRAAMRHLSAPSGPQCRVATAADLPDDLASEWADWLPPVLVLADLRRGELHLGTLALARDAVPTDAELQILGMAAEAYAHCWEALLSGGRLTPRQMRNRRRSSLLLALATVAAVGLAVLPVPSSVLAPAEVIPERPAVVRSALDGVVDRILVEPNQTVPEGQVLVQLDPRRLQAQLQAARLSAAAAEAELRQARQSAVADARSRAQLPGLQGRLDQLLAEVRFLEGQEERLELRAPRAGVVVLENAHEWLGRPVVTGERIMQVADPGAVELEIRLAAGDAIQLAPGARVLFFRNADPHRPAEATLTFLGYRATPGPDGVVAYRLKARFTEGSEPPRLGLKGTAKVYGQTVALGYYVLRRPLASLRGALGI
jgi:hypothetical protein